jgi:hypothetical protein
MNASNTRPSTHLKRNRGKNAQVDRNARLRHGRSISCATSCRHRVTPNNVVTGIDHAVAIAICTSAGRYR